MPSHCDVGEDSWESLGQQGGQTSQSTGKSTLNIHWKDWFWSWSPNILVTWFKQPTHWKSAQCWKRLKAEGEESVRGWGGWMISMMQCTWNWTHFGRGSPGVLQPMGLQSQMWLDNWTITCIYTTESVCYTPDTLWINYISHTHTNFKKKPVIGAYNWSWNISWKFEEKSDFLIIFNLVQYFKDICSLIVETQTVSLHLIC